MAEVQSPIEALRQKLVEAVASFRSERDASAADIEARQKKHQEIEIGLAVAEQALADLMARLDGTTPASVQLLPSPDPPAGVHLPILANGWKRSVRLFSEELLKSTGRVMTTREILDHLIGLGVPFRGKNPPANLQSVLSASETIRNVKTITGRGWGLVGQSYPGELDPHRHAQSLECR